MKLAKYLLALSLAFAPMSAFANTVTIPNTFVNGQFIDANLFNQNFQSIVTFANGNIDATNIGALGLYGSQIKPTSVAEATLGVTVVYTFPAGINVNGAVLRANSGLTVVGTTNLAATTFSVPPTMSGAGITAATIPNAALVTTPLTALTAGANISITGSAPNLTIAATIPPTGVSNVTGSGNIASSGGSTPNITLVAAPSISGANITTNTIPKTAIVGGTGVTSVTGSSNIASSGGTAPNITLAAAPIISGVVTAGGVASSVGSTIAYIPPMYSQFAVGRGATAHIVQDQATAGANAVGVTFTGAAIFTSALTYTCLVYDTNAAALITSGFTGISGTGFTFGAVGGRTYTYVCTGY